MLHLEAVSPERWLAQVDRSLPEILIDHAHCEKKAAGYALNLMFSYIEHEELCRAMTEIVNEELDHFHQVLARLKERNIRFRRLPPSHYGRKLNELARKNEPQRAMDRLLIAGLIEARSCERFRLLRDRVAAADPPLADFYGGLFESEARHHATYVRLAKTFGDEGAVETRLAELARAEAAIIAEGDCKPRMHS